MADLNKCFRRLLDEESEQHHKMTNSGATEKMKRSFKNTFKMEYDKVLGKPSSETPTTIEFITTYIPSIYLNLTLDDKHYTYNKQNDTWSVSKCKNKL